MVLIVVAVKLPGASPFHRRAFHERMLNRQWTRFSKGENAYCAEVRHCETEADAVCAVEADIKEVIKEIGVKRWSAACFVPDAPSLASDVAGRDSFSSPGS